MCRIISANVGAGVTIVPNRFIDEFMVDAPEDKLKVYLYFMRFIYTPGVDISVDAVAAALELIPKKVKDALIYWQEKGLITFAEDEEGSIERICIEDINAVCGEKSAKKEEQSAKEKEVKPEKLPEKEPEAEKSEALPEEASNVMKTILSRVPAEKREVVFPKYSKKQMVNFSGDDHFLELIDSVQEIIAPATMTDADLQTLAAITEGLDFSDELILHLYEYCCEPDGSFKGAAYVKKVAIGWAEKNITTVSEAKIEEQFYNSLLKNIRIAIGETKALGKVQIDNVEKWINEYEMEENLIIEACNRAKLQEVSKPFAYASRIIEDWHKKNAKTLDDVSVLDDEHKKNEEEKRKSKEASAVKPKGNGFNNFEYKPMTEDENRRLEAEMYRRTKESLKKRKKESEDKKC